MNLLIIFNDLIIERDNNLYIEKNSGPLIDGLAKSNIRIEIFQFRDKLKENDCRGTYNISKKDIKIVSIPRRKNKYISYLHAYIIGIYRVIRNDYVYLFYPNTFSLLAIISKLFGNKYGLYFRGEQGAQSIVTKILCKYANNIFTVSPIFTKMLNDRGRGAVTIAPMIDIGIKEIVRNRKYVNKKFFSLLYLGRIEYDKGIFDLIEAVKNLIKSNITNFELNIVGDGPDVANAEEAVNKYQIKKYILFHGTVSKKQLLKEYYMRSDLFILPSHHEGFPRVLYEAMMMGVPILTTFVGTISYLMKDGYNCYCLKSKNINSIVDQITEVLSNYSEKAKVAIKATETVTEYLSKHYETHSQLLLREILK